MSGDRVLTAGWRWVTLGDLSEAVSVGYVGSTSPFFCRPHEGVRLIRSQNIRPGRLHLEDTAWVTSDFHNRNRKSQLKPGDILITRVGANAGDVCRVPEIEEPLHLSSAVFARPRKGLDRFVELWLRSPAGQRLLLSTIVGSVSERINTRDAEKIAVPLPSMREVGAIAEVLASLDDRIELNRRINETLEAIGQAIFRDWFVDFGPVRRKLAGVSNPIEILGGIISNPNHAADIAGLFPAELGEGDLPTGWHLSTVGEAFNLTMGQSPPGETYNERGEGLPFFQGRTDFGFRFPERRKFCSEPTRTARPDDTLISVRAPVGDLNMAWEECCIGRGVAAARHKSAAKTYTFCAMRALQPELEQFEHTGTVFGAINKMQFDRLTVLEPARQVVAAFEALAGPLDDKLRAAVAETRTLAETRDYLLPRLMSGEVRVSDLAQEIAA